MVVLYLRLQYTYFLVVILREIDFKWKLEWEARVGFTIVSLNHNIFLSKETIVI